MCVILPPWAVISSYKIFNLDKRSSVIPMYFLYIEMNSNKFTRYYYTNDAMLKTSDAVFSDINFH